MSAPPFLDLVRIVLVRPRDPNNVGAAARALANFGVSDLVVVAPYAPVWREAKSAVGADKVLASARDVATLDEAIGECAFAGATTAGTRRRAGEVFDPETFATSAREIANAGGRVALVFGNEKSGLSAADLLRCHAIVRIPTGAAQPSMNLGQAVAVCCYELARGAFRGARVTPRRRVEPPATLDELERALAALVPTSLDSVVEARRIAARDRLRALLLRARATGPDVSLLRGLARNREP